MSQSSLTTEFQSHGFGLRVRGLQAKGSLVARVLAGAYSPSPPAVDFSESELAAIVPLLYQSGEAALAWWRIRDSPLAGTKTGRLLHDAYRHLRLAARVHEEEIRHVFSLLRAEGIEPVLVKGWASARRYPESGLRPYGDIDLCVRPDEYDHAAQVLQCFEKIDGHFVDLHAGVASVGAGGQGAGVGRQKAEGKRQKAKGRRQGAEGKRQEAEGRTQESEARSQKSTTSAPDPRPRSPDPHAAPDPLSLLVPLRGDHIRVLSDEEHLRVVCLHLLRSGAWRPLWLCDVAVMLETIRPDFDWPTCLGDDLREAEWIAATIALTRELLGAKSKAQSAKGKALSGKSAKGKGQGGKAELETRNSKLETSSPPWFVASVLRHWGRVRPVDQRATDLGELLLSAGPRTLCRELYARWDNPVRATVTLRGRFNAWPRLPYQLAELLLRAPELPRQLQNRER